MYFDKRIKGGIMMERLEVKNQNEMTEITEEMISEFVEFLKNKEEYLDTGLGVFHTDNHGNW